MKKTGEKESFFIHTFARFPLSRFLFSAYFLAVFFSVFASPCFYAFPPPLFGVSPCFFVLSCFRFCLFCLRFSTRFSSAVFPNCRVTRKSVYPLFNPRVFWIAITEVLHHLPELAFRSSVAAADLPLQCAVIAGGLLLWIAATLFSTKRSEKNFEKLDF